MTSIQINATLAVLEACASAFFFNACLPMLGAISAGLAVANVAAAFLSARGL